MSNGPSHIAYVVTQPRKGTDDKPFWRSVGSIWPHGKGDGFDLVIHDQLAVSGRIVCRAVKDKPADETPNKSGREPRRRKPAGLSLSKTFKRF